jgi:hypothetical protein
MACPAADTHDRRKGARAEYRLDTGHPINNNRRDARIAVHVAVAKHEGNRCGQTNHCDRRSIAGRQVTLGRDIVRRRHGDGRTAMLPPPAEVFGYFDSANRRVIVTYMGVPAVGTTQPNTLQAAIYESGKIEMIVGELTASGAMRPVSFAELRDGRTGLRAVWARRRDLRTVLRGSGRILPRRVAPARGERKLYLLETARDLRIVTHPMQASSVPTATIEPRNCRQDT